MFFKNFSSNKFGYLLILALSIFSTSIVIQKYLSNVNQKIATSSQAASAAPASVVRGNPGDLWADLVIGKRDFAEISEREVTANKLSKPQGVLVDKSVSPGRLYIWDANNSRIVGVNLATCYGTIGRCKADIIIGQPTGADFGACNRDSSFQTFPLRPPSSATTLCGMGEWTHTVQEDGSISNMALNTVGDLFVADAQNNRVLRYNQPFSQDKTSGKGDSIADDVWGQANVVANGCNRAPARYDNQFNYISPPKPTSSSLCFDSINSPQSRGSSVTLDASGNMWVADGGNNRVLRFPADADGGIGKTANLVLGQKDFTTGGDYSSGTDMNRMYSPNGLTFDPNGKLYVADTLNKRVLVFTPPFTNGMTAQKTFGLGFEYVCGVTYDSYRNKMWISDSKDLEQFVHGYSLDGTQKYIISGEGDGCASVAIDANQDLLIPYTSVLGTVQRFHEKSGGIFVKTKNLFAPPDSANITTARRLETTATGGISVTTSTPSQLIVADSRLLFWNDLASLTGDKSPDGYVGTSSFTDVPTGYEFGAVKVDAGNRVWVTKKNEIRIYQAPLHIGDQPVKTITSVPFIGSGSVSFADIGEVRGLAPSQDGSYLWVSQPDMNRVIRIRNPLSASPLVDVVLGQKTRYAKNCNQGNTNPTLSTLCNPGRLSIDKLGNLYVSDHDIELRGNYRMLIFAQSTFPPLPSSIIFAPNATKEFPKGNNNSNYNATFEPAFNSANNMVVGYNPYKSKRHVGFYKDPLNPTQVVPDQWLNDFYGWPLAATFSQEDDLYVYDANRGQVRIYKKPFSTPNPNLLYLPLLYKGSKESLITCTNRSDQDARLQLTFYAADSPNIVVEYVDVTPIPPNTSRSYLTTNQQPALPASFTGSAVVTPTQPLNCIVTTQATGPDIGTATNPAKVAVNQATSIAEANATLFIPFVTRKIGNYFSVQNVEDNFNTVTVSYRDQNGVDYPNATQVVTIPPHTSHVFEANTALPVDFTGSAKVTGTGRMAAQVVTYKLAGTTAPQFASFNAVAGGSSVVSIPRFVRNFQGFQSQISIQNVGTTTVNPQINLGFGSTNVYNFSTGNLSPGSVYIGFAPQMPQLAAVDQLTENLRKGYGWVSVVSGGKIAVVISEINEGTCNGAICAPIPAQYIGFGASYNAITDSQSATKMLIPGLQRKVGGGQMTGTIWILNTTGNQGTCSLTFENASGANKQVNLYPSGVTSVDAGTTSGLPDGYRGALIISQCTQPIAPIVFDSARNSSFLGDSYTMSPAFGL